MVCTRLAAEVWANVLGVFVQRYILPTLSRKAIVSGTARYISIYANHDAVIVTIIFLKSVLKENI